MSLASYSDLVTELSDFYQRTDFIPKIPTFIRLFEARMNRKLRTPDQEINATITLITNVSTYQIPTIIRQVKSVTASTTGIPMQYSIDGTQLTITPIPDGLNNVPTITITGYNVLTPLDGVTTTTNWLLASHPDAYLFGTLTYASIYLRDEEHLPIWRAAWDDALADVLTEGNQRKIPSGPIRTNPAVWE